MSIYHEARKKTEGRIRNVFWSLYEKQPINKITVAQVSQLSNIHRTTFYIHFADIYEILEKIEADLLTEVKEIDVSHANSLEGLSEIGYQLFHAVRQNYRYLKVLLLDEKDPEFSRKYRHYFYQTIESLIQEHGVENTIIQDSVKHLVAVLLVDCFITSAGDPNMSFEDTEQFMLETFKSGYYSSLKDEFGLKGLIEPK